MFCNLCPRLTFIFELKDGKLCCKRNIIWNIRSLIFIIFHLSFNMRQWHFLLSIIFMVGGSKACILSTDITGLRNPTRNFGHFPSLYVNQFFKKICPTASSRRRQIQLVVVLVSSELKLSHLRHIWHYLYIRRNADDLCFVLFVSLYVCPVYHSLQFAAVYCAVRYGSLGCYLIALINFKWM